MTPAVLYPTQADLAALQNVPIAVLGYGSQGRAHALNLRDAGCRVTVGQRAGAGAERAREDGFSPLALSDAARQAELLIFTLPDESMGSLYQEHLAHVLRPGQTLGFVHGFAIRYGQIAPPSSVNVILVAPKGPGTLVREMYQRGGGLACLFAVQQDATGNARQKALGWGAGIGAAKGGMIETTFAQECEADLFGEQAVLCGGIIELMKAAYDVLVEAGYPPEVAYFECIHEVKQIVDLQYRAGLEGMRARISNTAAYGGLTRGPRLVTDETRRELRRILDEIRDGRFAQEWIAECASGLKRLVALEQRESQHPSEAAGRAVRSMSTRTEPADDAQKEGRAVSPRRDPAA